MEPVYRTLEVIAASMRGAQGVRVDYRGLDNIPTTGGAVLAINHTGYLDFVSVALGSAAAGDASGSWSNPDAGRWDHAIPDPAHRYGPGGPLDGPRRIREGRRDAARW